MRLNDGRVVPNFIRQALAGQEPTLYGNGSQTRSFCFVDELIEGVVRCAADVTRGLVLNLGNPIEYSIRQFAQIVIEAVGVPVKTTIVPLPSDDPQPSLPRCHARKGTAWLAAAGFA